MRALFSRLKALWSGELPLRQAFWDYAVFWGMLINLGGSFLSLIVIVTTRHASASGAFAPLATWLLLALHLLPLPYNLLVVAGVWRSAGKPAVPAAASAVARAVTIALFVLFLMI